MLFDVLGGLKEIKICYAYELDGKVTTSFPSTLDELYRVKPIYLTMPGFNEDLSNVKSFDELPENAKEYIKKIEELTKTTVSMISVGPDRNQTIIREKLL